MARPTNAAKNARSAPAETKPKSGNEVAEPELHLYYRLRKISSFLYEILEVEVDDNKVTPKVVSKQDLREILIDKIGDLVIAGTKKKPGA